jgi:predicted Zn-dependent protease
MNLKTLAEKLVTETVKLGADQAQVQVHMEDSALTRFAQSQIHQNVARKMGGISVKAIIGKSIGTARINGLREEDGLESVKQAYATAKLVPEDKNFVSLPGPKDWDKIPGAVDNDTASCSPDMRAKAVKAIIETAHNVSPEVKAVAGSISTGLHGFAVANSLGVSAEANYTMASTSVTVISGESDGLSYSVGGEVSRRLGDLDPSKTGLQVSESSVKGLNPVLLKPGVYETILMPNAGTTAFGTITRSFGAMAWRNGTSFVRHHDGEKVFDDKLTIVDDPRDPETVLAVPVDGEGVPKARIELVTRGFVGESGVCYDSYQAYRDGKKSTGHAALPGGRSFGAAIGNIVVAPGDSSVEEMIEETKRGVLVTQFNYNAVVDPSELIISGLTRNGTFLIENGEITNPILNLRYTDSMLTTLKNIPLISKERERTRAMTLPSFKVDQLRFTGGSEN